MKKDNNFYQWAKTKTSFPPTKVIDYKISLMAREHLASPKSNIFSRWLPITLSLAATALVILTFNIYNSKKIDSQAFTESPEMLLNFKRIELMADASELSEVEWKKIEGNQ
ncbi:MAG: hypothetical protein Q7U04_05795 [Bacteriovorax sp.]|nr:hypothetical protein [Bacteriovorax sp.]